MPTPEDGVSFLMISTRYGLNVSLGAVVGEMSSLGQLRTAFTLCIPCSSARHVAATTMVKPLGVSASRTIPHENKVVLGLPCGVLRS